MPCNCDHMEPTGHEAESHRVAEFLVWLDADVPDWVRAAARNNYGNRSRVDELTAMLCERCEHRDFRQEMDGRRSERMAYKLGLWWLDHQKADREKERAAKEKEDAERLRRQALGKLTGEEKKALGL